MERPADTYLAEAINAVLPNGLHEGVLRELRIDFAEKRLEIRCDADMSQANYHSAVYKSCKLTISELWGFHCETLIGSGSTQFDGQWMDGDIFEESRRKALGWPDLPDDVFAYWLFLRDLNAFVYFAGRK